MDKNEARELLDKWKRGWVVMNDLSTQIVAEEIWLTLGYSSFTDMFESEGMNNLVLAPPARRSAIKAIIEESPGISNRKIAEILGVNEKTVRNDSADNSAPILPKIKPPRPKSQPPKRPVVEEIVVAEIVEELERVHDCPACGRRHNVIE